MKKYKNLIAQIIFVIACVVFWQVYATQRNIMGFPTLDTIFKSLISSFSDPQRPILVYLGHSLVSIIKGLGIGIVVTALLMGFAISKRKEPMTDEEIIKNFKGPFTVTFIYNGNVFGTQTVKKGECAQMPSLMPAPSGSWDFDFNTPITEDVEIIWK